MTDILSNYSYNITALISDAAVENPETWLASFNALMGYWPIFILLILFGIVLFNLYKQKGDVSDSEAISAAGFITTFIGILLFVIEATNGYKLLSWAQFVPIVVVTAIAFAVHKMSKNY
jgi:hypothetical protein